jgi:hypothetical protein
MKLNDVIKRVPFWYYSQISVYLKSQPGVGKTTTLVDASSILSRLLNQNIGHVVINGPLLTPGDAVGYLIPKHQDGYAESIYTDPFWFRTKDGGRLNEFDGGIIIVDEADKMDTDVKKVIGEAALSGRLGPHTLAGGWVVWMAGNRAQDRSGSTKELDHLINRRMEIDITSDLQSFLDWSAANGVTPLTRAFANQNPQIIFPEKTPDKQGSWCTPRSLVMADKYMQVVAPEGNVTDDPILREEISGLIGEGSVAQYFAFVKLERELPKFESIVKDPMGIKVPEKPDAQMLSIFNLAHRVDDDTVEPVIKYVARFGQEFAVPFAKSAVKRLPALVINPAVRAWCSQNASLMAALAG